MLLASLSSLGQGNPGPREICGGGKVWRSRDGWRETRGRARDEGQERRTRGETGDRQSEGRNGWRGAELKRKLEYGARMEESV